MCYLNNKKELSHYQSDLKNLHKVAKSIAQELDRWDNFCLWLSADMGDGKTTFTKYLLVALGLSESTPVVSPTYTYLTEYYVNNKWIAHLDLYRLNGSENLLDLGLSDIRPFTGFIVEWPQAVRDPDPLFPTHVLEITASSPVHRLYHFFEIQNP